MEFEEKSQGSKNNELVKDQVKQITEKEKKKMKDD